MINSTPKIRLSLNIDIPIKNNIGREYVDKQINSIVIDNINSKQQNNKPFFKISLILSSKLFKLFNNIFK